MTQTETQVVDLWKALLEEYCKSQSHDVFLAPSVLH